MISPLTLTELKRENDMLRKIESADKMVSINGRVYRFTPNEWLGFIQDIHTEIYFRYDGGFFVRGMHIFYAGCYI